MSSHRRTIRIFAVALSAGISSFPLAISTYAQTADAAAAQQKQTTTDDKTGFTDRLHSTVVQNWHEAWEMLTDAAHEPKHADARIQALAALGTLGTNARAGKLIEEAMKDPDVDVRTAAVLAAGQTNNRNLTTPIRNMLDDKEPQVAFVAATTLWKRNDRSGEDILVAVVDGDRRATADLKDSTIHTVSKDLHSPSTLAKIGALQGASVLLGPFGFGITAYEYMRKNGGDTSRVSAIEQISQEKTAPIRSTLIAALGDKDPAVRAASAKALGAGYRDKVVSDALLALFDDSKLPVRLTAAAAYLRSTDTGPADHTRTKKDSSAG